MMHTGMCSVLAVAFLFASAAYCVDGIAVSANYGTGEKGNLHINGCDGDIVAYIIKNSKVEKTIKLYEGEAQEAVISTDGRHCAFRKNIGGGKGIISVADIATREVSDLYKADNVMNLGRLAWPKGKWLYFTLGWPEYDKCNARGGNVIWRVDVEIKKAEHWFTFKSDGGVSGGLWYWCFNTAKTRMVVRPLDDCNAPWGQNVKFELNAERKPPTDNIESLYNTDAKYGSLGGYGCGAGLSPSGNYLSHFTSTSHNGWQISNWDKSNVKTFGVSQFDNWGGEKLGGGNFGNKWSANDDNWWSIRQSDKQVLLNWKDEERIVVTQSGHSETGDLWVGDPDAILGGATAKVAYRQNAQSSIIPRIRLDAAGTWVVDMSADGAYSIQIVGADGRVLSEAHIRGIGTHAISTGRLSPGMYLIRAAGEGQNVSRLVVKQ
jgi:hypothetical protein